MCGHNTYAVLQRGNSRVRTSLELLLTKCEDLDLPCGRSQPLSLILFKFTICSLLSPLWSNIWGSIPFYKTDETTTVVNVAKWLKKNYVKNVEAKQKLIQWSQSTLFPKKKIWLNWVKIINEVTRCQDSNDFYINKESTTWNFSDCGSIWQFYRESGDYFFDWVPGGFAFWHDVQGNLLA